MKSIEKESMKNYIIESLKKYPPLSSEEEKELFLEYNNGNIEARNKIVNHNLRLVYNIVNKNSNVNDNNFEDVFQFVVSSIIDLFDYYDIDKNYKFSTYLTKIIHSSIIKYFLEYDRSIRVPHNITLNKKKVLSKVRMLLDEGNNIHEVCKILNISMNRIVELLEADGDIVSLNAPVMSDGKEICTLGDTVSSKAKGPEETTTDNDTRSLIIDTIESSSLTEREKEVIYKLYYSETKIDKADLADKYGCSRTYISILEKSAFKKIRLNSKVKQLVGLSAEEDYDLNNLSIMRKHYMNVKENRSNPIGVENGKVVTLKRK